MDKLKWEYRIIKDDLRVQINKIEQHGSGSVRRDKIKFLISEYSTDQIIYSNNKLRVILPVRKDRRSGYHQWHQAFEYHSQQK